MQAGRLEFPPSTLASRDALCKTPPPFLEKISFLAWILGESRDSKRNPCFDRRAKRAEIIGHSRTNSGRESRHIPDSRSGLKIGDYTISLLPPVTRFRTTRTLQRLYEFFFRTLFLSGRDSGLVSLRRVRYRFIQLFSIHVDSPRDKRGKAGCGNRGLRCGIGADSGRFG